jgi:protein-S-isoprenylcysteine O-methyltransferase Ste14
MRIWAVRTLGPHFTGLVTVEASQPVIDSGPYALLRHPAYSGALLAGIGGAVLFASNVALALTLLLALPVYLFRIRVEEQALGARLGAAYARYRARTWMLVPFVL